MTHEEITGHINALIDKMPKTESGMRMRASLIASRKRLSMGLSSKEQVELEIGAAESFLQLHRTSPDNSELEMLKAENARLRYELELLKNPAEKHLHDQLSKAVGDSINAAAAALEKTKKDLKK